MMPVHDKIAALVTAMHSQNVQARVRRKVADAERKSGFGRGCDLGEAQRAGEAVYERAHIRCPTVFGGPK
jgi:hypothetical protein